MRQLAALVMVAACGSGVVPESAGVAIPPPQPAASGVRTGRHAAQIVLLAASDDGTGILTQDTVGATRLWPSLDGTHEPIVVPLVGGEDIAIGHARDAGFVIAAIDEARGGEVLSLDEEGAVLTRASMSPEPRILSMTVRGLDVLILREDQTIDIVDRDGHEVARLDAPPASRIHAVASRGERAIAVIERDGAYVNQWIARASWGATLPRLEPDTRLLPADRAIVALSPGGTHLLVQTGSAVAYIDLATARVLWEPVVEQFAFIDETHYMAFGSGNAQLREPETMRINPVASTGVAPRYVGGRIVAATGDHLRLTTLPSTRVSLHGAFPRVDVEETKQTDQYLGYAVGVPTYVRATPAGVELGGGANTAITLDSSLATISRRSVPAALAAPLDSISLDAEHVLTTHALNDGTYSLSVSDVKTQVTLQVLTTPVVSDVQRYEPSTGLLVVTGRETHYLVRRDPTTSTFSTWYRLDTEGADTYVVDPALAAGVAAVVVRANPDRDHVQVERYRSEDITVGAPLHASEVRVYEGRLLDVGRNGRVYVRVGADVIAYDSADEVMHIPHAFREETGLYARIAPGPRFVAVLDFGSVSLYTANGALLWDTAERGLQSVQWMGDELVASFEDGLAKLDLDTGRTLSPTCGWGFGLSDTEPEALGREGESICDAL